MELSKEKLFEELSRAACLRANEVAHSQSLTTKEFSSANKCNFGFKPLFETRT